MTTYVTEEADIGFVRHQLDVLVADRYINGWGDADRDRYKELCISERSLLWTACAAA
jgi:hypothetical protein